MHRRNHLSVEAVNQAAYLLLMALLADAGWAFSFYCQKVVMGKMSPNVWWMPAILLMTEGNCQTLVGTPYGKIVGKPNAFWGDLYYPYYVDSYLFCWSGTD